MWIMLETREVRRGQERSSPEMTNERCQMMNGKFLSARTKKGTGHSTCSSISR
jgi:hypothetical protein